jgi:hypothetical protein
MRAWIVVPITPLPHGIAMTARTVRVYRSPLRIVLPALARASKATTMKIDTITLIISGALLAAALIVLFAGHLRRRHHVRRLLVMDLLRSYFKGDVPANQLGRSTREIVSKHFTRSDEFYSLVVAAFQTAVDAAQQPHNERAERKLLRAMAALKHEFGVTDRYQVQAWRPGRE